MSVKRRMRWKERLCSAVPQSYLVETKGKEVFKFSYCTFGPPASRPLLLPTILSSGGFIPNSRDPFYNFYLTIFHYQNLIFIIKPNSSPFCYKPHFWVVNTHSICIVKVSKQLFQFQFCSVVLLSDFIAWGAGISWLIRDYVTIFSLGSANSWRDCVHYLVNFDIITYCWRVFTTAPNIFIFFSIRAMIVTNHNIKQFFTFQKTLVILFTVTLDFSSNYNFLFYSLLTMIP